MEQLIGVLGFHTHGAHGTIAIDDEAWVNDLHAFDPERTRAQKLAISIEAGTPNVLGQVVDIIGFEPEQVARKFSHEELGSIRLGVYEYCLIVSKVAPFVRAADDHRGLWSRKADHETHRLGLCFGPWKVLMSSDLAVCSPSLLRL